MYTVPKRVERDGFLVAYKGEVMSDDEARRRGLIGHGESAEANDADVLNVGKSAVVNPPIDEEWADAAGMSVDECKALWDENPSAVLDAIKANLAAEANDADAADTANDDGADDANANADSDSKDKDAKPSKEQLRAECEARGIKAPKNATIAQLEALLEG